MGAHDGEIAELKTEVSTLKKAVGELDAKVEQILEWVNQEKGARKERQVIAEKQRQTREANHHRVEITWAKLTALATIIGVIAAVGDELFRTAQ
jgi:hypothetical protein